MTISHNHGGNKSVFYQLSIATTLLLNLFWNWTLIHPITAAEISKTNTSATVPSLTDGGLRLHQAGFHLRTLRTLWTSCCYSVHQHIIKLLLSVSILLSPPAFLISCMRLIRYTRTYTRKSLSHWGVSQLLVCKGTISPSRTTRSRTVTKKIAIIKEKIVIFKIIRMKSRK